METSYQQQSVQPVKGGFLKAMIKINNPTWTPEQIEKEFDRQMKLKDQDDYNGACESCSG